MVLTLKFLMQLQSDSSWNHLEDLDSWDLAHLRFLRQVCLCGLSVASLQQEASGAWTCCAVAKNFKGDSHAGMPFYAIAF